MCNEHIKPIFLNQIKTKTMQMKLYKNIFRKSLLGLLGLISVNCAFSQVGAQGLKITSVDYTATTATVYVKSVSLTNIIGLNGSIVWDKNSLQHVSTTMGANASTLAGQFNANQTNGTLTYIVSEPNVNTVSVATDTILFKIVFNVINNPLSTYRNNSIAFSNAPLPLEVDTFDLAVGPVQVLYPALENHTAGAVSFARNPVLSYAANTITDSVTNRPAGCTYQWFESGNAVTGPSSSTYANPPAGSYTLQVTYPNTVAVMSLASVTPVKLANFSGKSIENRNQLTWTTTTELNTNNFEIERSENAKDFVLIGKQKAVGTSSLAQTYTFNDVNNKSALYYRLKINDNNGTYSYSNIIKISKDSKATISLYPNPSRNIVSITGDKMEQITVTDIIGKIVLQKSIASSNNTTLNVAGLSKGIYSVNVKNVFGTQSTKLIVE